MAGTVATEEHAMLSGKEAMLQSTRARMAVMSAKLLSSLYLLYLIRR